MINENLINDHFKLQKEYAPNVKSDLFIRKRKLKELHDWISGNIELISEEIYKDFKKPHTEISISEIYPVLSEIRHGLSHLKSWLKPNKVEAPLSLLGTSSYVQYEPKGVSLIIAPWNYPFMLAVAPLVSALLAGNTAVIKPSEMTPHTASLIEKMVKEVFDESYVCVFNGDIELSTYLLSLPFDHIFFTGSPGVGKIVMKAAAENLTSVTLELGGKSPVIIDADANLKDAAQKIAWGKFANTGQTCVAPDYIMVSEKVKDSFIKLIVAETSRLFNADGLGFDKSPDYARVVNKRHFERQKELIADALTSGATLECGSESNDDDCFISPTIFTNVPISSRLMTEEIFGPVLPIITISNIDDAIQMVNSRDKPLALYYFGRNRKNKRRVLNETSSGTACINDCVIQFAHKNLPFGGVNHSGIGKAHGYHGFLAFSNEKAVVKQRVGLTFPKFIYPPYTPFVKRIVSILTRYL